MVAISASLTLRRPAATGTPASAAAPSSAPSTRTGTRVLAVSTIPAGASPFCRAIASATSCTVMPSVASRAWLNSTNKVRGISPRMVTFSAPGSRRSRSRMRSAWRTSSALSAPVSANTAPYTSAYSSSANGPCTPAGIAGRRSSSFLRVW